MAKMKMLTLCLVLFICCFSTAFADEEKDESGKGKKYSHGGRYDNNGGSYFHTHGYTHLNIPKGHYPPPGECRIWYPDRPAGHQPPPGACNRLQPRVPPGAWLIYHPEEEPEHVHVIVYDVHRPGSVLVIGEFEIGSGTFLRVVVNR